MLTTLFVLILMIAQTEKLGILSFWPSRFSPCRLQWRSRLWPHKKQWLQDQRAIESYLFPINIHRIGRNHRANDWVLKNIQLSWRGCLAGRPSFRHISLELSCYEYSDSQLGDGSHRVKLTLHADPASPDQPLPTPSTASSPRPCRPIRGSGGGQPMREDYSVGRLNCSYFGVPGWNFWYINNVVDDPSVDYYK